jgi:hypothetical protein
MLYPYRFEPDAGGLLVQFIDVPEAHTFAPTEAEAGGDNALDYLIAALGGYINLGRGLLLEVHAETLRTGARDSHGGLIELS